MLIHSRLKFTTQETTAIEDFIEKSHKYINRYDFCFKDNENEEKAPHYSIENYNCPHDYVIIYFWDAKVILELSTQGDETPMTQSIDVDKPDDDRRYFLIHFSYGENPKLKKVATCDSLGVALGGISQIFEAHVSKFDINFIDNLFVEKFKSVELNELERFKNRIENIIKSEKLEDVLTLKFNVRNDNYLHIRACNGCIKMSLDRAKSNNMRLFVVEDYMEEWDIPSDPYGACDVWDAFRTLYFYTSMSEAIRKVLSLLDSHIDSYRGTYYMFTER